MTQQQQLVALLADGELHSGSDLAAALGVSRAAIWKQISQLDALGIQVSGQAGQGYRLASPVELLDKNAIAADLSDRTRDICTVLETEWVAASTNDALMRQAPPPPGRMAACVAEYQTAGRGRRGRQWFAPAGHGICLSVGWSFASSPPNLSCLGLAAGVGVLRALRRSGVPASQLKWPNDVVVDGRKLAGILVDVQGEAGGPLFAVVGVGVNYVLSAQTRTEIEHAAGVEPTAITLEAQQPVGRNATVAVLLDELAVALQQFAQGGFSALLEDWLAADYLRGRTVLVNSDSGCLEGIAEGITDDGRLCLNISGRKHLLVSGDLSVRAGG